MDDIAEVIKNERAGYSWQKDQARQCRRYERQC